MAEHEQKPRAATDLERALLSMDRLAVRRAVESFGDDSPFATVDGVVVPALESIGARWERGDVALSQVYMAGRICEELLDTLLPLDPEQAARGPRIALTALHDFHLLGKRLVGSVLRANGFAVLDYGRTEVDELVERCRADRVEILLISTLMLSSALRVREVVDALKQAGGGVRVGVGGAPFRFDTQLWREVGADGFGRTASDALSLVRNWSEVAA